MDINSSEKVGTGETQRFLCFALNQEEYAVPLLSVKEVIAMPDTTPIPNTPAHFLGIMNLRGQVISIVDLRVKFGFKTEKSSENCVIICDFTGVAIGVVVSGVKNVLAVEAKDIGPSPSLSESKTAQYVTGVVKKEKKLILLIDLSKALGVEERKLAAAAGMVPAKKAA